MMYVQTLKQDNYYMKKYLKQKEQPKTPYAHNIWKHQIKMEISQREEKKKENPNLTGCTITYFCRINLFWKLLDSGS